MSVERILVTGNETALHRFTMAVFFAAINPIERRGQTIFYTVMGEDLPKVIEQARGTGVTVQHMEPGPGKEVWTTVIKGESPPWGPKKKESSVESSKLCPPFIVRKAGPRYLTPSGSWTNNPNIAQRFDTESAARRILRTAPGEIIPESGL